MILYSRRSSYCGLCHERHRYFKRVNELARITEYVVSDDPVSMHNTVAIIAQSPKDRKWYTRIEKSSSMKFNTLRQAIHYCERFKKNVV